ncbi:MAG TPA: molybdenum cofactor guanylyltransferase [Dehalococcoidia bacterium]|nr:molybdenum cofactor guanylyltransferase [Dehalococcoidia bacterium]
MPGPLSGIVLAGGSSRRLGVDKAALTFEGRRLLDIIVERVSTLCTEVIVAGGARSLEPIPGMPVRFVPDTIPGQGPLAGLQAGLAAAREEFALAVACDMPFLNTHLLAHMAGLPRRYQALVPLVDGRWHPTHAIYARACLPVVEELLAQGGNSMEDLLWRLEVQSLPEEELRRHDPDLLSLFNVNEARDLARARALWRTRPKLEISRQ